jgi:hypothetical protein
MPTDILKDRKFFGLIILVLFLWTLSAILLFRFYPTLEERGQFGDMFGAVNSLFSGLAMAGVVYAVVLQVHELREAREEAKKNEAARELQAQIFTRQLQTLEKQFQLQVDKDRYESAPSFQWAPMEFPGGSIILPFTNKGGRFRIIAAYVTHNARVSHSPEGHINPDQRGCFSFNVPEGVEIFRLDIDYEGRERGRQSFNINVHGSPVRLDA